MQSSSCSIALAAGPVVTPFSSPLPPLQIFTIAPPIALGLFDQDVSAKARLCIASLYHPSQARKGFNSRASLGPDVSSQLGACHKAPSCCVSAVSHRLSMPSYSTNPLSTNALIMVLYSNNPLSTDCSFSAIRVAVPECRSRSV